METGLDFIMSLLVMSDESTLYITVISLLWTWLSLIQQVTASTNPYILQLFLLYLLNNSQLNPSVRAWKDLYMLKQIQNLNIASSKVLCALAVLKLKYFKGLFSVVKVSQLWLDTMSDLANGQYLLDTCICFHISDMNHWFSESSFTLYQS